MKKIQRIMALCLCTLFLGAALHGCNTMEGVGKDIEKGGQEIEEAAD